MGSDKEVTINDVMLVVGGGLLTYLYVRVPYPYLVLYKKLSFSRYEVRYEVR